MIKNHLSDIEIQEAASDEALLTPTSLEHLSGCIACRSGVENYRVLINSIKHAQEASFEFNLQELVMSRIGASRRNFLLSNTSLLTCCGFIFITPLYVFKEYLWVLFKGMTSPMLSFLLISAVLMLSIQCFETYSKYRKDLMIELK